MGRIALFVIAVGGLFYVILHLVVGRLLGIGLKPVVSASASIIVAVIAWTVLIWFAGDRLGRGPDSDNTPATRERSEGRDAQPTDLESASAGSTGSRPEEE